MGGIPTIHVTRHVTLSALVPDGSCEYMEVSFPAWRGLSRYHLDEAIFIRPRMWAHCCFIARDSVGWATGDGVGVVSEGGNRGVVPVRARAGC